MASQQGYHPTYLEFDGGRIQLTHKGPTRLWRLLTPKIPEETTLETRLRDRVVLRRRGWRYRAVVLARGEGEERVLSIQNRATAVYLARVLERALSRAQLSTARLRVSESRQGHLPNLEFASIVLAVKSMKRRDLLKLLAQHGCVVTFGKGKGSHAKVACGKCKTIVPNDREITIGTLGSIRDALAPCLGRKWLD